MAQPQTQTAKPISQANGNTMKHAPVKTPKTETEKLAIEKEKAETFKRVAARRTSNILKSLSHLANCANNNVYSRTDAQVTLIFSKIDTAVSEMKAAYAAKTSKKDLSVSL